MQAPSIPNLLSFRGSSGRLRGGGRGRGRGRGREGHATPARLPSQAQHDATIQGTDTDAAIMRQSCVELGYLDDPFSQSFVRGLGRCRRLPIINRGTYTRTAALDRLIDSFLASAVGADGQAQERQIISLGAGTDTRCFRLFSGNNRRRGLTYHEIDYPTISARKQMTVQTTPALREILPDVAATEEKTMPGSWRSDPQGEANHYWCHGCDLRVLVGEAQSCEEGSGSRLKGLRTDVPTLLLSECCLCYLETSEAKAVIQYFLDRIPDIGLVIYEPVNSDDAFGRQMTSNLAARKIKMPTLEAYRNASDHEKRLREAGFSEVRQNTVDEIWRQWISEEEKERVNGLEGLDEVEEWELLASHYIVSWGWRGKNFAG